jgi:hypothetical protein
MADEQPAIHIDTDWKKQAQEEKKRLAEEEAKRRAAAPAQPSPAAAPQAGPASPVAAASGERGEVPAASFATLVQSLVTQILFYVGDLAPRGQQPVVNMDMAKHNIDMLGVLEAKTRGNLSDAEQHLLDNALYETRMRFVNVATQMATV